MKIYTKTGKKHYVFKDSAYHVMDKQTKYEISSIFWHDQHDHVIQNVPFDEAFPKGALEHLRNDRTSKILLFYGDEYYNLNDLTRWANHLREENILPEQLYIFCLDENWKKWTEKHLANLDFCGVNIQSFNLLLNCVDVHKSLPLESKFSAFSRNYNKDRLEFFINLEDKNLLTDFVYTFHNIHPYGHPAKQIPLTTLYKDAHDKGYVGKSLKRWIKGVPYTLPGNNVRGKLSPDIYEKIASSGINVVIESHFDPFWNFGNDRDLVDFRDFSPAFPTEKTYKPIACDRPFIIFSTPEFLKEFRQLGYKTFHPYIDETYDTIEDNSARLKAIVSEIERLTNLPEEEYNIVIAECEKIAKHNKEVLIKEKSMIKLSDKFKWLEPLINKKYSDVLRAQPKG